jgi:hypothetical protein
MTQAKTEAPTPCLVCMTWAQAEIFIFMSSRFKSHVQNHVWMADNHQGRDRGGPDGHRLVLEVGLRKVANRLQEAHPRWLLAFLTIAHSECHPPYFLCNPRIIQCKHTPSRHVNTRMVCICVCVCVCVCAHAGTSTVLLDCKYTNVCKLTRWNATNRYLHAYIHMHIHAYTYIQIHGHTHTHTHAHTHTRTNAYRWWSAPERRQA